MFQEASQPQFKVESGYNTVQSDVLGLSSSILGCALQLNSSCTCFFPPFSRSYHPVLYIQMSHPKNEKGNRGTARTKTGRQEIRQHIRDGAASE